MPPAQGLPGMGPGSLLVPKKAIYGFADAPRCFWLQLEEEARRAGWVPSQLERGLFYFYTRSGVLGMVQSSRRRWPS